MKTKKILFLIFINLGYNILFGQGENDNWYFGDKAALNFSGITPTVISSSALSSLEASGSISDSNGNLLFYVSREYIYNRQNQAMPNGTLYPAATYDLGTSNQQLAIVKNPANPNQYFVFMTPIGHEPIGVNNRITYSIVDMSLGSAVNGVPLGDVVQNFKNIPVTDNFGANFGSEAITAVAGPTNNTYWILIPNGNNLYSYKIDNQGFSNGNPVVSSLNVPNTLGPGNFYSIKASPRINDPNFTNYICVSHWNSPTGVQTNNRVLSFDTITGTITNHYSLVVNGIFNYLPEFNRDASVLFLGNTSIFAIDLLGSTTGNVNSMQIFTYPSGNSYTGIQRNKYGAIYLTRSGATSLGQINNPDIFSSNMNVTANAVNLGNSQTAKYGLPQLIPTFETNYYQCMNDLVLTSENNISFYYRVGKTITTKDNYALSPRHNITMQAGETISLLPGTHIQNGANYHAFIAPCRRVSDGYSRLKSNNNQRGMVLNLDIEERKMLDNITITISPNPASTYVNIDSGNQKITSWELYDMSGKNILKGNSTQINVQSLPKATYLLNININNKIVTKKIIVK